MIEKILTGIEGLDDAMGGIPKDRTILITGGAGSGKTIFGLQFAREACLNGRKVVYLATEEPVKDLKHQASVFNWDFEKFEKAGNLLFIESLGPRLEELDLSMNILNEDKKGNLEELVDHIPDGTEALVVDSLGSHAGNLTPRGFKERLDIMVHKLNQRNITTILILDSATSKDYNDFALFSVYGALRLVKRDNPYTGLRERIMDVVKMRSVKTPLQPLTYKITENGIQIQASVSKE